MAAATAPITEEYNVLRDDVGDDLDDDPGYGMQPLRDNTCDKWSRLGAPSDSKAPTAADARILRVLRTVMAPPTAATE